MGRDFGLDFIGGYSTKVEEGGSFQNSALNNKQASNNRLNYLEDFDDYQTLDISLPRHSGSFSSCPYHAYPHI